MKKIILASSAIALALSLAACGDSQAEKEREHAAKVTKAVPMPEVKSDAEIAAKKIPVPSPEIKLGEPPIK